MAGIVRGIHKPIIALDREPIMPGKVSSPNKMHKRLQNDTLFFLLLMSSASREGT